MDAPELMISREVADLFRVDIRTVNRWGNHGQLAVIYTPGGRSRYLAEEVRRLYDYAQRKDVQP